MSGTPPAPGAGGGCCPQALPDRPTFGSVCPDSEVEATASNYTLQNLEPGTAYRVGVWEVTEDSNEPCSPWQPFQTKALGNG